MKEKKKFIFIGLWKNTCFCYTVFYIQLISWLIIFSLRSKNMALTKGTKVFFFLWTDNEVELLLRITLDYKTKKAMETIDWKSSVTKYGDILKGLVAEYPASVCGSPEEKDFPQKIEEITKIGLTTKLKAIGSKYRQAVDSGRNHGTIVLLYFDLCQNI